MLPPRGMIVQYTTIAFLVAGGRANDALGTAGGAFHIRRSSYARTEPRAHWSSRTGSTGGKKKQAEQSKVVQFTSTAFVAVAIGVWLAVAPRFFPKSPARA